MGKQLLAVKFFFIGLTLCLTFLNGCVVTASHKALNGKFLPELIQRESFFDRSQKKYNYQISPDGKKLAWLAEYKGRITIFIKPLDKDRPNIINTHSWCNISWYRWAEDSSHLVYSLASGTKRPDHLYASDIHKPGSSQIDLTPDAVSYAAIAVNGPVDPEKIIYIQSKGCRNCLGLYKTDIKNSIDELIDNGENETIQWIINRNLELKGRIVARYDKTLDLQLYNSTNLWQTLATWGPRESIRFIGFTEDEKGLWLLSSRNRDRIGLVRFDIKTATETLICEDPKSDIEDVTISLITGNPLFAYANPDYPKTYILDPKLKTDLDSFTGSMPAGIKIISMDRQEQLITIKIYDDKETSYFLYDRASQKKQLLGQSRWPINRSVLADVKPVVIQSRDGLPLNGYLTLPETRSQHKLPTVLYVHGGPWARDYWEPDPMVQFLANRGYAVLQINYRGSSGYGQSFQDAAIGEFAKSMHDDLIDAVNWAVDQNIADPDNVAIVGGSYGGFAAMAGLTFTPETFACGISINGVSNWIDYLNSFPSPLPLYRKRGFGIWYDFLGNPANLKQKKDIQQRSPLFFTDKVVKPILIIYGNQDKNVNPDQSTNMINSLRRAGKNVTQKKFDTEGHGIQWLDNSKVLYKEIETFLARHIGGRREK